MGARPVAVRQADIARVMRAVRSAGVLHEVRVVIEEGRVVAEALRGRDGRATDRPPTPADEEIVPLCCRRGCPNTSMPR